MRCCFVQRRGGVHDCGGRVLVEKGRLTGWDEQAVFHAANALTADLLKKAGK